MQKLSTHMPEKATSKDLTLERVLELLSYDQDTGIFTRKVNKGPAKQGNVAGSKHPNGYIYIKIDNKSYPVHRLAWLVYSGDWPSNSIDHINERKDDNRIVNLRDVTGSINNQNRSRAQSNNTTGLLGVHWHKRDNRFVAEIKVNGKSIHLGYFHTAEEARSTYISAKRMMHEGNTL